MIYCDYLAVSITLKGVSQILISLRGRAKSSRPRRLSFVILNSVSCILSSFLTNKPKVKQAKINLCSYITRNYENSRHLVIQKTNPIQTQLSQNKANSKPIAQRPKMYTNIYYTKVYKIETAFSRKQNKAKQTQFLTTLMDLTMINPTDILNSLNLKRKNVKIDKRIIP